MWRYISIMMTLVQKKKKFIGESYLLFTLRSFPNPATILLLNLHQVYVAIYFEYHSTHHQAETE